MENRCVVCGAEFAPGTRGQPKKYCGKECRRRSQNRRYLVKHGPARLRKVRKWLRDEWIEAPEEE